MNCARAEKWLQQISSEIEQKFLGADDSRPVLRGAPQQNENHSPAGLSFLRRRRDQHKVGKARRIAANVAKLPELVPRRSEN